MVKAEAACNAYWDEFKRATAARDQEIQEIEDLKAFVSARANEFGQYGPEGSGVTDHLRSTDYKD